MSDWHFAQSRSKDALEQRTPVAIHARTEPIGRCRNQSGFRAPHAHNIPYIPYGVSVSSWFSLSIDFDQYFPDPGSSAYDNIELGPQNVNPMTPTTHAESILGSRHGVSVKPTSKIRSFAADFFVVQK